jgi:hypothetical protein
MMHVNNLVRYHCFEGISTFLMILFHQGPSNLADLTTWLRQNKLKYGLGLMMAIGADIPSKGPLSANLEAETTKTAST